MNMDDPQREIAEKRAILMAKARAHERSVRALGDARNHFDGAERELKAAKRSHEQILADIDRAARELTELIDQQNSTTDDEGLKGK